MELDLKGKRVLVTGSASGIGRATAAVFLAEGAEVIVNGLTAAEVEATLAVLSPLGPVSGLAADLGRAAGDLSSQAMAAGQQMIAQKVLETECSTLECMGGKAVIAAALPSSNPSADSSMQDSSQNPVPFPRPRPDRMG